MSFLHCGSRARLCPSYTRWDSHIDLVNKRLLFPNMVAYWSMVLCPYLCRHFWSSVISIYLNLNLCEVQYTVSLHYLSIPFFSPILELPFATKDKIFLICHTFVWKQVLRADVVSFTPNASFVRKCPAIHFIKLCWSELHETNMLGGGGGEEELTSDYRASRQAYYQLHRCACCRLS